MLKKKEKVPRRLVQHIIARGKGVQGAYLTLCVIKNTDAVSKFSFVVSKKVASRATDRNTIKRRGYAAVSNVYKDIKPHTAALFFVKKEVVQASFRLLQKDVIDLLARSGSLSKN